MPITDIPFKKVKHKNSWCYYPYLPISIVNPHTKKHYNTFGLIDTGADICSLPASIAKVLDINLREVKSEPTVTANGNTDVFPYKCVFEIFHPTHKKLIHKTKETPINFMPNLPLVLLGVDSFLSNFVLTIDYPQKTFSIKYPEP